MKNTAIVVRQETQLIRDVPGFDIESVEAQLNAVMLQLVI